MSLVGYGRVGKVLCRAFQPPHFQPCELVTRQIISPPPGWIVKHNVKDLEVPIHILILTLRDRELESVCSQLITHWGESTRKEGWGKGLVVAHTAGALSAEVLSTIKPWGVYIMSWHPLQTFTGEEGPEILNGITVGIDGDPEAVKLGEEIAKRLGAIPFPINPQYRALYHLGAVFACNFMAALIGESIYLLKQAGIEESIAQTMLQPLLMRTVHNLLTKGLPQGITGPLRRGDLPTIERHLEILTNHPRSLSLYVVLSEVLQSYLPSSSDQEAIKRRLKDALLQKEGEHFH
ncbi:MAG: Rossmann-like and DUF2520 domain-containing protein [bacterium]